MANYDSDAILNTFWDQFWRHFLALVGSFGFPWAPLGTTWPVKGCPELEKRAINGGLESILAPQGVKKATKGTPDLQN